MVLAGMIGAIGAFRLAYPATARTLVVTALLPLAVALLPGSRSAHRDQLIAALFAVTIAVQVAFHVLPPGS